MNDLSYIVTDAFKLADSYLLSTELSTFVEFTLIFQERDSCRFQFQVAEWKHNEAIETLEKWLGPLIRDKWTDL